MAVEMKFGDHIKGGVEVFTGNLVPSIVALVLMMVPILGIFVAINWLAGIKAFKAERNSALAKFVPRQKCAPKPNARCGFGSRVMSKR